MSESINNNTISQFIYTNQKLKVYDTDNDGALSVFELENINDEQGINILSQELQNNTQTQEIDINTQIETLNSKLKDVKDEQGVISSAWNAIKCATGLGSSTKKCEQAIEDFKNGKISYEEADSIISSFSEKQKSSVSLVSNIATGIAAVAVVGSAVATGGLSLGVIAAAAGVGAGTKAGLKFLDRATNKVEGDAIDAKEIAKDALSGAVDGAVSVATMGIGTSAVTAKTVTEQTLKQTIIQGAKAGALDGAISGAVTGAADYTIEAALEENVEFNLGDLAKTTVTNAAGGAVAGGVLGGASSGIQYKGTQAKLASRQAHHPKVDMNTSAELSDTADALNKLYKQNAGEAEEQIKKAFSDSISPDDISGRPKSSKSIFDKLANKFEKNKLKTTSFDDCMEAIGDAYGTRIKINNVSSEQAQNVIENALKDTDISYNQFIKYLELGDKADLDDITKSTLKDINKNVINELKEIQTKDVFESFIKGIKDGELTITELNNYGDDISSYFTPRQVKEIANTYYAKTGKSLDIVTQLDDSLYGKGATVKVDENGQKTVFNDESIIKEKGSTKDSGYASAQANVEHTFKDGSVGHGELQIRGKDLNEFADVEHIPYDIKSKKIIEIDTEYAPVYNLIKGMPDEAFTSYNSYLTKVYNWLRLKELGIETSEPAIKSFMQGFNLSDDALNLLSRQGLINFSKTLNH